MDAILDHLDDFEQIVNELDGQRLYTVNQLAEICPDADILNAFEPFERTPAKAVLAVLAIKLGANLWEAEPAGTGEPGFEEIRQLLRRRIVWLRQAGNEIGSPRSVAK